MPPRKRKRSATTTSADASGSKQRKASRKKAIHKDDKSDAFDQEMQLVGCLSSGPRCPVVAEAIATAIECRFLSDSKAIAANQVLKQTILDLLQSRKPGSSC